MFQVTVPTVNEHMKGIYAEGELAAAATIRNSRIVRTEGKREVSQQFFATVQNKMHWAAHGQTAAEVIHGRVNRAFDDKPGGLVVD